MKLPAEGFVLLLLLATGAAGGVFIVSHATPDRPPDFSVPTTDNRTFTLSEHRGEVVVLDFFATWCASCKIVEEHLQALEPEWQAQGVTIASIGIDDSETLDDLRAYQEKHNITWTVAKDTQQVAPKYNTYAIARIVVLDRDGALVYEETGVVSEGELRSAMSGILAGNGGPVRFQQYGLLGLAAVAGVAAFFSPCSVGMLPSYVTHAVRAQSGAGPRLGRTLLLALLAALGVLLVFFGIGGLALLAGPALTRYVPFLEPLVGFLLIAFGALLLARPFSMGVQRITEPLTRWAGSLQDTSAVARSYFAYGIAYGAAAAGCTTPVLLSVLVTAAASGPLVGSFIVIAYAATAAFLMVVVTFAAATFRGALGPRLARWSKWIEIVSALVFILGGMYLVWFATRAGTFNVR